MVKAELSYNPYLQETEIRFNGQSPRINSHVEKYLDKKLQTWIHKLPYIFRDEMNGYGFELEFSGTELDYEELKRSFSDAGVSDAQVHIFHKNELDGRDVKIEKVEQLLNWLDKNPNQRYDIEDVRKENYDLLDGYYEYVILHGRVTDMSLFDKLHISVENIDHLEELNDTNLHNIPILYVVDQDSAALMRAELRALRKRPDVTEDQIFFRIRPNLSEEKVVREISDLGIINPQVVQSADDPAVLKYFELFPFTDYIHDRGEIEKLDSESAGLKESLEKFINPDRTDFSVHFLSAVDDVKYKIVTWRTNKTKITQPEEAVRVSREFDSFVLDLYQDYLRKMHSILTKSANAVQGQMRDWYEHAGVDTTFIPGKVAAPDYSFDSIPSFQKELLEIKEEAYVTPKEDFLGRFFKPASDTEAEPVLETTYYYKAWRSYALKIAEPYLQNINSICVEKLNSYFEQLGSVYKEHLQVLIEENEWNKSWLSSSLSEEEQQLQNDNDWLIKFSDMVKAIARE